LEGWLRIGIWDREGKGTVRAEGLGGQRDWQGRGTRGAEGLAGQRADGNLNETLMNYQ